MVYLSGFLDYPYSKVYVYYAFLGQDQVILGDGYSPGMLASITELGLDRPISCALRAVMWNFRPFASVMIVSHTMNDLRTIDLAFLQATLTSETRMRSVIQVL